MLSQSSLNQGHNNKSGSSLSYIKKYLILQCNDDFKSQEILILKEQAATARLVVQHRKLKRN